MADTILNYWRKIKHEGKLSERATILKKKELLELSINSSKITSLEELFNGVSPLLKSTAKREAEWISLIFRSQSDYLAEYVRLRLKLLKASKQGDIQGVNLWHQEINKQYGKSFTFLETELFLQSNNGYEEASNFLSQILSSEEIHVATKFIAASFHHRHSPYVPAAYHKKLYEQNAQLIKSDRDIKEFISFLGNPVSAKIYNKPQILDILYQSSNCSLIDIYENTLRILHQSNEEWLTNRGSVIHQTLKKLNQSIKDSRLDFLLGVNTVTARSWKLNSSSFNDDDTPHGLPNIPHQLQSAKSSELKTYNILTDLDNWSTSTLASPFSQLCSTTSDFLRGTISSETFNLLVSRFYNRSSHQTLSEIETLLEKGEIVEAAIEAKALIEERRLALSITEFSHFLLEVRNRCPAVFMVAADTNTLTALESHEIENLDDLPVVLTYSYLTFSKTQVSIMLEELLDNLDRDRLSEIINEKTSTKSYLNPLIIDVLTCDHLSYIPTFGETKSDIIDERLLLLQKIESPTEQELKDIEGEVSELVKERRILQNADAIDASQLRIDEKGIITSIKEVFGDDLVSAKEKSPLFFQEFHRAALGIFLLDEEHGLDAELSNRIRHGRIKERLISPFSDYDLSTSRNTTSKTTDIIKDRESDGNKKLLKESKQFIERINNRINQFGDEEIQLKVVDRSWQGFPGLLTAKTAPNGLICVESLSGDSYKLFELLLERSEEELTISEAAELALTSIWDTLELQLKEVQRTINEDLRADLTEILDEFEKATNASNFMISTNSFANCRNRIEEVCSEVSGWFVRPSNLDFIDCTFEEVAEMAKGAVNMFGWETFVFNMEDTLKTVPICSENVGGVYDILVLIFSNSVKHGIVDESDPILINWSNHILKKIVFSNRGRGELEHNLSAADSLITEAISGGQKQAVNNEFRSGLVKIVRLLRKLGTDGDIPISVREESSYFILELTMKNVL